MLLQRYRGLALGAAMLLPAAVAPAGASHASLARLAVAAERLPGGISGLPLCSADVHDLLLSPVSRAAHAAAPAEAAQRDCRESAQAAARCTDTHGTDRDGPAAGNAA